MPPPHGGGGKTAIATTPALRVATTLPPAVKFPTYYYVVSAVNSYGEGADSTPEASATALGAYGPTAYESFNYATGTFANNTPTTAAGFSGNWTVSAFPNIVAGLSYSNLPTTA